MLTIEYDNKKYSLDKEKLFYILEKLEQRKISQDEIEFLMNKYGLYDEVFLENVNKIW